MNSKLSNFTFAVALLFSACFAQSQVPVVISPVPKLQFFDTSGRPLASGCVFSYQTLSSTPLATYTDYTGTVQNSNPLILTAGGFVGNGGMWLAAGLAYRLVVKSSGGSNCASGSTISTVDGIGGGTTTLTTSLASCPSSPVWVDAAQNQLFICTLTANVTSQPMTATGIIPPGIVTWQLTQDNAGGHTFSWPSNTIGGATICASANCTTLQTFIWNGTSAIALGPAVYSTPAIAAPSIYDYFLSPSAAVCTDANLQLVSGMSCNSVLGVTYNGQTVDPGGSGNVNQGAAAHSVALNEGNGNAISGLTLGSNQLPLGVASADPSAVSIPSCTDSSGQHLNYTTGTPGSFTCGTSSNGYSKINYGSNSSVCTTSGADAGGGACTTVVSWNTAFADTNYIAVCQGITLSGSPHIMDINSLATTSVTVTVGNGSAAQATPSSYAKLDCIGLHP